MSSGLSMASVNKIKELANSKEYSLAVDILENQDLSKSLNPQFLRLCGEIYLKTNMYKEARDALIRAHKLAPEAKRVMFLFVDLYFRMGYKELAETYYNMYLFENQENTPEIKQLEYIYKKANNSSYDELVEIIEPMYAHSMDYDWSFELFLLYRMQGEDDKANALIEVYTATYKNTNNILVLDDINNNYVDVEDLFDVYSKDYRSDDDPEQENMRLEEAKLLEDDDLRMNPKEAEITIVFDDRVDSNISKRKLKKLLKEQNKETDVATETEESVEGEGNVVSDSDASNTKKGLFKKVISKIKKNNNDDNQEQETELPKDNQEQETELPKGNNDDIINSVNESKSESVSDPVSESITDDKTDSENDIQVKQEKVIESNTINSVEEDGPVVETDNLDKEDEPIDDAIEDIYSDSENNDELLEDGDFDMRKKHNKFNKDKYESFISVEEDDDFIAESDTIEELSDDNSYSSSPYSEDSADLSKNKMDVVFEEAKLVSDDSVEEFEVDDFSAGIEDEFGAMDSEYEEPIEETYEEPVEETYEEPVEETYEEPVEETYEESIKEDTEEIKDFEEVIEEPYKETTDIVSIPKESNKSKLDFPVFRSSLFPEYKRDISVVENNFNEIMTEAQDKFNENKLKEEQMLKEAEALLASMGISLDNISVTDTNPETVSKTINNEPSRDDLKASLEIDSVKKDILDKLKEYR